MAATYSIRILEKDPNKRGDLFGRLMTDLFLALGYDEVRLSVHKAGREIDLEAWHRTERRRVVAECKATKKKTGGDEINKFIGGLDAERRKYPDVETGGYFISLSGFKETAIEQEQDAGGGRAVLLDGGRVVEELVNGRILVSLEHALERAGRCAAGKSAHLAAEEGCELLAHEIGWVWAVYYAQVKERTHFALIHADGEPLAGSVRRIVIAADQSVAGHLHSLRYLAPAKEPPDHESRVGEARDRYFEYLATECGAITLEGLPADQDVGVRRLKLENIFVPLYLEELGPADQGAPVSAAGDLAASERATHPKGRRSRRGRSAGVRTRFGPVPTQVGRRPVGEVLGQDPRLAILASPGGGKTTLLKRLAVTYAFPERSDLVDDNLPHRKWLPLLIRCRQLGELAKSPIAEILRAIPHRAEMSELAEPFADLVHSALRTGQALLLVDGLDEISDEGARVSFVTQLRTFLATYPTASLVITSREAGFRIVGGALSAHCRHYRVADFDDDDIRRLTLAWHKEVLGDTDEVRGEAEKLAEVICDIDRVRDLATNPLLLTTLLLVKRWVGQLPTRRSVLYGKAIEVLLMTWNVEGYEPIDQDEAIPQLAFAAFAMMTDGAHSISARRLNEILRSAREQMPEILGYARIGVSEFIERVELRSSLMVLTGHEIENGTLCPMYEFRHLTFQEYLAARAVVDGYYPERRDADTLVTVLEPHFGDPRWKEVVPLAAVLSGRAAGPLVARLVSLCEPRDSLSPLSEPVEPLELLAQCILDEVQVSPPVLEEALRCLLTQSESAFHSASSIASVARGKYAGELARVAGQIYCASVAGLRVGSALALITLERMGVASRAHLPAVTPEWAGVATPVHLTSDASLRFEEMLLDRDPLTRAEGALALMRTAYLSQVSRLGGGHDGGIRSLQGIERHLVPLLHCEEPYVFYAACWAIAWLCQTEAWDPQLTARIFPRLLELWGHSTVPDVRDAASWSMAALPLVDRLQMSLPEPDSGLVSFIQEQATVKHRFHAQAALIAAYYLRAPWTDGDLATLAGGVHQRIQDSPGEARGRSHLQKLINVVCQAT